MLEFPYTKITFGLPNSIRPKFEAFGIMSGEDKILNPQSSVAKATARMARIRAQKFQEKRLAAGLNIVQRNFARTVEEEYGLVPMGNSFDIGPDLTDVGSHDNCKYCFCRCVVNQMDSRLVDVAALRCEHCRFYD